MGSAASVFIISVVFLAPSSERFTYWVYGRYNEGVLLPLLMIALLGLEDAGEPERRRSFLASCAAAGIMIGALAWVLIQFWTPAVGPPYSFNASGISIFSKPLGWGILRASATAGIGLAILGSLFFYRWRWGVVGLTVFFGLSTAATYEDSWVRRNQAISGQQELIRLVRRIEPRHKTIFFDPQQRRFNFNYYNASYFLPDFTFKALPRDILRFTASTAEGWVSPLPPRRAGHAVELVLSGRLEFGQLFPGARLVGLENLTHTPMPHIQGLWVFPGPLQEALEARGWLFPKDFPGALGDEVLRAQLRLAEPTTPPRRIRRGQELPLGLEIVHRGSAPWPHRGGLWNREYSVGVFVRWLAAGSEEPAATAWVNLPRTLYPGESVRLDFPLRAAAVSHRFHRGGLDNVPFVPLLPLPRRRAGVSPLPPRRAGIPLRGNPQLLAAGTYRVTIAIAQVIGQRPRPALESAIEIEIEVVS